jgi:hypothetical protein
MGATTKRTSGAFCRGSSRSTQGKDPSGVICVEVGWGGGVCGGRDGRDVCDVVVVVRRASKIKIKIKTKTSASISHR